MTKNDQINLMFRERKVRYSKVATCYMNCRILIKISRLIYQNTIKTFVGRLLLKNS